MCRYQSTVYPFEKAYSVPNKLEAYDYLTYAEPCISCCEVQEDNRSYAVR